MSIDLARLQTEVRDLRDENERLRSALRTSSGDDAARWSAVVRSAPDQIMILDLEGRVTWANQSVAGFDMEQILGRSVYEFVPPESCKVVRDAHRRALETRSSVAYEIPAQESGGSRTWSEVHVATIESAGESAGLITVSRDITAKRRIEEALVESEKRVRLMNQELERRVEERTAELSNANLELESFSYAVSHDLRAPLRAMNSYACILLEDHTTRFEPDEREMLERIQKNAVRMGRLIDEVLAFTKLGQRTLDRRPVALTEVVHEVWRDLQPDPRERRVEFTMQELPVLSSEPSLLYQVFWHLVSNALKYTRPRSAARIEVGVAPSAGEPMIFVRDNGVGFDPALSSKLFGVFQRLHREDEFEGLGIGLALVRRIVERHGGRVSAEGAIDSGATVRFTLGRESA